jgi:fluoroquinolone transport system permease protein
VLSLGLLYTFVGLGQVSSYDSVTTFLFPGALVVSLILQLPFLHVLGVPPGFAWYLVPTQGPLLLMLGAFERLEAWQWLYGVSVSVLAVMGAYAFARVRFRRHVRLQER